MIATKSSKFIRLRHTIKAIYHVVSDFGFDPLNTLSFIRGIPTYVHHSIQFRLKSKSSKFSLPISAPFPCLTDRYQKAGYIDKHYFHQDLWAARKIYERNPSRHIDVGSRVDGFIAHLLTFRDVEVLDIRSLESNVRGMTFRQVDVMDTDTVPNELCDSVSCLHALEHFGLGRYGDPIDPEGHIKGLRSLIKMLKPSGVLLLSVPIGRERVEFNGHRIFLAETVIHLVSQYLHLTSFSYIDDEGILHEDANLAEVPIMAYGCGLFEFRKQVLGSPSCG